MRELRDGRGDLEALVQDDLLALQADILRPLHEAGEVGLRLDVLAYIAGEEGGYSRTGGVRTDTEVLGTSLEQGVLLGFGALAGPERGGGRLLRGSLGGLGLVIETSHISNLRACKTGRGAMRPEL